MVWGLGLGFMGLEFTGLGVQGLGVKGVDPELPASGPKAHPKAPMYPCSLCSSHKFRGTLRLSIDYNIRRWGPRVS